MNYDKFVFWGSTLKPNSNVINSEVVPWGKNEKELLKI
jgi:hypothetical protein